MPTTEIIAALMLGIAGSGHCLGMCGGIAIALRADDEAHSAVPVAYHLGRILSYAALGALIGGAANVVQLAAWTIGLRLIAGLLLIAMGLHVLSLWRGVEQLERLGARVWRLVVPLSRTLMPPRNPSQALVLGSVWGLMPCGLIYSALGWSAAAGGSALGSGVLMLLFGVGTLPAMLGATLAGQRVERLLRNRHLKQIIGIGLLAAGSWTLMHTLMHWQKLQSAGAVGTH
jgi:sulfite exporter TauE/SafE